MANTAPIRMKVKMESFIFLEVCGREVSKSETTSDPITTVLFYILYLTSRGKLVLGELYTFDWCPPAVDGCLRSSQ